MKTSEIVELVLQFHVLQASAFKDTLDFSQFALEPFSVLEEVLFYGISFFLALSLSCLNIIQ